MLTVFILMATAVCAAHYFAGRTAAIHTETDVLMESLAPVKKIVAPGEQIHLVADVFNPTLFPHTQFALVPNIISAKDSTNNKWTLYIWNEQKPVDQFTDTTSQHVYWQQQDSLYHYRLTQKNDRR